MDIHHVLSPILLLLFVLSIIYNLYLNEQEEFIFIGASFVIVFFILVITVLLMIYINVVYGIKINFNTDELNRLMFLFIQYLITFVHSLLLIIKNCMDVS